MKPKCESCVELEERLSRLEKRFDEAEERGRHWHKRWQKEHEKVQNLEGLLSLRDVRINELEEEVRHLRAQIAHLQKLAFGDKSEITPPSDLSQLEPVEPESKRKRGKQPGAKGFGRKTRVKIDAIEATHDVHDSHKNCLECGAPRVLSELAETSEEIDYEWKLIRVVHKRLKYKKTCRCSGENLRYRSAPAQTDPQGTILHALLDTHPNGKIPTPTTGLKNRLQP